MIIDIIFALGLILAFIHGINKGLIHSIVSLIAIVVGILAAVHLSEVTSVYIDKWFNISSKYLPLISFLLVFIIIFILFRLLEKALEGFFKVLQLNFLNKLAGAIIWSIVWILFYSTLLFYADNMQLLPLDTKAESIVFEKIEPLAPKTIETIGKIIPPVKNIFNSLQEWFKELENKNSTVETTNVK